MNGRKASEIMDIVKDTFFELGESEALELEFQGRLDVTPKEYLSTVRMRAANVEADARTCALIGGGTEAEVEAFSKYGRALGMLLIIRDDFVDMFEEEELLHRFDFECLPLPLLYALQNTQVRKELVPMLERKTTFDLDRVLNIVLDSDEINSLRELIESMIEENTVLLSRLNMNESVQHKLELLWLATGKGL